MTDNPIQQTNTNNVRRILILIYLYEQRLGYSTIVIVLPAPEYQNLRLDINLQYYVRTYLPVCSIIQNCHQLKNSTIVDNCTVPKSYRTIYPYIRTGTIPYCI